MITWLNIQDFAASLKWALAGFIGAMVVSRFHREDLHSKKDYAVFAVTGALIAHYMTAPVAAYFALGPESTGGVGFLLGAFGGSLFQAVVRALKDADLWAIIKARFGGGK